MRKHAEAHGVKNIRLPLLVCGLDKLQPPLAHQIVHEVFQKANVCLTVCMRDNNLTKRNG